MFTFTLLINIYISSIHTCQARYVHRIIRSYPIHWVPKAIVLFKKGNASLQPFLMPNQRGNSILSRCVCVYQLDENR